MLDRLKGKDVGLAVKSLFVAGSECLASYKRGTETTTVPGADAEVPPVPAVASASWFRRPCASRGSRSFSFFRGGESRQLAEVNEKLRALEDYTTLTQRQCDDIDVIQAVIAEQTHGLQEQNIKSEEFLKEKHKEERVSLVFTDDISAQSTISELSALLRSYQLASASDPAEHINAVIAQRHEHHAQVLILAEHVLGLGKEKLDEHIRINTAAQSARAEIARPLTRRLVP